MDEAADEAKNVDSTDSLLLDEADPLLHEVAEECERSIGQETDDGTNNRLIQLQNVSNITSHVLALLCIFLVSWWINLLGGLSVKSGEAQKVFNFHPLLMVMAFAFMTVASLSFRNKRLATRALRKLVHGISWSIATLFGAVALFAVFASHSDRKSGLIANFYSLHSWVGVSLTLFYLLHWLTGLYAFAFGNPSWKHLLKKIHMYVGLILYQGAGVTILLGIQEKEGFYGCGYPVTDIELFPHLRDIPVACRVSHGLGIVVLLLILSTSFALADFSSATGR